MIGSDSRGVAEAVFLRSFTSDVTLIAPDKALSLTPEDRDKLKAAGIDCVDGPAQAVAISDSCIVVDTAEGHFTFDSVYPALGSRHAHPARGAGRSAAQRTGLHRRRCPPADERSGPLCGGRRGDRPRPDQPCDGRRRRRGNDDPQRSGERSSRCYARNSGSRTTRPSQGRRCRRGTGLASACRWMSSISSRSPAPKFSTAATVPTACPSRSTHGRPTRSA